MDLLPDSGGVGLPSVRLWTPKIGFLRAPEGAVQWVNTKHSHHSGDSRATSFGKKRSLPSSGTAVRLCSQKPGLNHPHCVAGEAGGCLREGGKSEEVLGFSPVAVWHILGRGAPGSLRNRSSVGRKGQFTVHGAGRSPMHGIFPCRQDLRSVLQLPVELSFLSIRHTRIYFFSMFPLAS